MNYTDQQIADLYEKAVSAEAAGICSSDAGYALDDMILRMADNTGEIIRRLIDDLRAAGRRPDGETPVPGLVAEHCATMEDEGDMVAVPRGLLGTALGAISHPSHAAPMTIALLKAYAYQRGHELTKQPRIDIKAEVERLPTCAMADATGMVDGIRKDALYNLLGIGIEAEPPINTGLSWEAYKGISGSPAVADALDGFTEDATEDNAVCLIRAIAEALRPRPRFWLDMHGYSCYLRSSEAEAVSHCNETGGLYVLPLFAGEPINAKLPTRMCRPADEPQTVEVSPLLRNLQAIPQRYTSDYVSLAEVFAVIEALKGKL